MDQSQEEPQRLSALYQYHNAPEVAPAHGLEHDDTFHPSSDKYPVIREASSYDTSNYKGKHAFPANDNRPPRIIFGMKVRTFLLVAAVMILVVVGAAVGGAVGGKNMRDGEAQTNAQAYSSVPSSIAAAAASPATPTSTSTFSAATPTYTPLSDCPASNNTSYTSTYASGASGTVPSTAGLTFTKYCDRAGPASADHIAAAFVYSFSDCVELCAGLNFRSAGRNCTVAVYQADGKRPGNCWVGGTQAQQPVDLASLGAATGTDVALLRQS